MNTTLKMRCGLLAEVLEAAASKLRQAEEGLVAMEEVNDLEVEVYQFYDWYYADDKVKGRDNA